MTAYYNEIDPYAAQWPRNLIDAGHIAPGVVDERSIHDVKPSELKGYTQCHFFAGLGGWSYALRRAGWADDRPVWTGSCPCQPFSSAGLAGGFADERHLWPFFHFLIEECGPGVVFGEQVASKDGLAWLDLVQTDLEGAGYAFGAVDLCAAGVGAPHIRQRSWFVAERLGDTCDKGLEGLERGHQGEGGRIGAVRPVTEADKSCGLGYPSEQPRERDTGGFFGEEKKIGGEGQQDGDYSERPEHAGTSLCGLADTTRQQHDRAGNGGETGRAEHTDGGSACGLADTASARYHREVEESKGDTRDETRLRLPGEECRPCGLADTERPQEHQEQQRPTEVKRGRGTDQPGGCRMDGPNTTTNATDHLWRAADWLFCRDGKWRPVEPGTSPLAHGAPARVGRLRAYGNAINVEAAKVFIESYLETRPK